MKKIFSGLLVSLVVLTGIFYVQSRINRKEEVRKPLIGKIDPALLLKKARGEESEASREKFTEGRIRHEFEMLRNPITGKIPDNYHQIELKAVQNIPSKSDLVINGPQGLNTPQNLNTYQSVGPNNVAGRSRTLAVDRRNSNILLTGGTTGGIFRSTNGGTSWTFVSPEDEIRSITSIVQDTRAGFQDTWYAGTGEVFYPTSSQDIAGTVGYGMFKSTNNGVTWTKLLTTEDGDPNSFAGRFDLVHQLAVHPSNGHVYAAIHNRIVKSIDGGVNWTTVLGGVVANSPFNGMCDILIKPDGSKIFVSVSGGNAGRAEAGIWESTTGNVDSWQRIAGGVSGQADSIAGWAAYGKWGRAVMAISPANKLYILYKNANSASGSSAKPEADLFQADISSGNPATYVWKNLSDFVPNDAAGNIEGINPYTTQFFGFNMSIAVKPDDENTLFIGGTCLHRVNLLGTTNATKFTRAGGYGRGFIPSNNIYPNHHPDVHGVYFFPGNNSTLFTASDGGIHKTSNALTSDTIRWTPLTSGLQTMQYQFVSIIPDTLASWIIGGSQDNGTYVNLNVPSSLSHEQIDGGDGAAAAMTEFKGTGSTLTQHFFSTIVNGSSLSRLNLTWELANNTLDLTDISFDEILPEGIEPNSGQWLTLFAVDPRNSDHMYFNHRNNIYRTTRASTVDSSSWTELTGVGITNSGNLSSMAVSNRSSSGIKYLYFGTATGKVFRLNNADVAPAITNPSEITPPTMTAGSYVSGISVNPRNADTVLVVVSNYDAAANQIQNIFWSGNATSATPTWQVIDGALGPVSSQSCAIVIKSAGVEYYVGTSVGLYSTTSINGNNTSWVNEGTGMMKKAIIRSLSYRQSDNTLAVGTHGNGAFIAFIGDPVKLTDLPTSIPGIIINDKTFIKQAFPTLAQNEIFYTKGSLLGVKGINIRIMNMAGQLIYSDNRAFSDGRVNISNLTKGSYVLQITSQDLKHQFIQQFVKN